MFLLSPLSFSSRKQKAKLPPKRSKNDKGDDGEVAPLPPAAGTLEMTEKKYKLRPSQPLHILFDAFATMARGRLGRPAAVLAFKYDGHLLDPDSSPKDAGLEEGDVIDAYATAEDLAPGEAPQLLGGGREGGRRRRR